MSRNRSWFDDYEEYRLYQEIFGEEDDTEAVYVQQSQPVRKKKAKRPLTEEELERNGKVVRITFITVGLIFAVLTLWNNIGWLFFLPAMASWPGIIISIIVLVLIAKNISYHHKERKKKKDDKTE